MQSINYYYENQDSLRIFLSSHGIVDSSSLLIQVFTDINEVHFIEQLRSELNMFFSFAKIIGTTTDGQIADAAICLNTTIINFTYFEKTSLEVAYHIHRDNGFSSGKILAQKLIQKETKVLISFATCYNTSGEEYLQGISSINKDIIVSGGIAAHSENSKNTYVFTKDKVFDKGAVAVSLNSKTLQVYTDYSYNWSQIGVGLTITKAVNNRVYKIGTRTAYETYKHYLGEDIAKDLPASGTEFPLIINKDGFLVSRAVTEVHSDGSLSFAGAFHDGNIVEFGYGDIKSIYEKSTQIAQHVAQKPAEVIFIYSCLARRHYLNDDIINELHPLANIAPVSGFFTHGEFYTAKKKEFLNQTMTLLVLSESTEVKHTKQINKLFKKFTHQAISINALAHLINVVSEEIKENRKILQNQKDAFETLFEKSAEGILLLAENRFIDCNETAYKSLGYPSKEKLLHVAPYDISPQYQPDGRLSIEAAKEYIAAAERGEDQQFEWVHLTYDGIPTWFEIKLAPIEIENKKYVYASWRNIQNRKEMQERLYHQANHDVLTGLANRNLFYDRLQHAIAHALRDKAQLVLFFIDLDMFKEINDSFGHDIGDLLLKEVAQRLKRNIRDEDTVARIGGDEFTIIMENVKNLNIVAQKAQNLLEEVAKPYIFETHTFHISCSIGISVFPYDAQNLNDLVKYADTAMYKAKQEGRNRGWFYSNEMTQIVSHKIKIENGIREAIKYKYFETYFQPVIDARNGKIVGAEALIRWNDIHKGMILPDEFIPIAEQSDLIIDIDNWMMQSAIAQFSQWYKEGKEPGVLSLNLAIKQLENPHFLENLQNVMELYDFKPEWLKLEILERQVMQKVEENSEALSVLKALGISLAIDDFGTGESSFLYLKKFRTSQIKIDKSFVMNMNNHSDNKEIVKAIIALGNALNLEVLAEGVETENDKEYLLQNGCYLMQGHYFAKAVKAVEFVTLLQ